MFLYTLIEIVSLLINVIVIAVIIQFVLSLLLAFNVVNRHNGFVDAVWTAINAILEPVLRPIRKVMPATGAIAAALGAARLFLLTDVAGVLDKAGALLTDLTPAKIAELQADGTISGGMIPKLETCIHAVEAGCEAAVVLDGRVPHAMLLEIFTSRGAGTLIRL